MGNKPNRKHKRNKALIADYKSGKFDLIDLVKKYEISYTRIYRILRMYKVPTRQK